MVSWSSSPLYDEKYKSLIEKELLEGTGICDSKKSNHYDAVTEQEKVDVLCSLNRGKAADIYGLTTEHLIYAANNLLPVFTYIIDEQYLWHS